MNPEHIFKDIKKQFGALLKKHPEEKKHSVGFVFDNLEVHHVKAALYMSQNNGMHINAYNLHDLILNYDQYKVIAECSPDDMVISDLTDIQSGAFNPKHLFLYFQQISHANYHTMKSGHLKNRPHCPACNKLIDGFTAVDHNHEPKPYDVTICAYCNEVLQFTDDMSLKLASPEVIEKCGLLEISKGQRQAREFKATLNLAKKIKGINKTD